MSLILTGLSECESVSYLLKEDESFEHKTLSEQQGSM